MAPCALLLLACSRTPPAKLDQTTPRIVPADGKGESTAPWIARSGIPVETAPPNVPEFKPAFPGQTRAPGVVTQSALDVIEVANDLDKPWSLALLPDGRMLVTEKHTGRLSFLGSDGKKTGPLEGVPAVDGRDQGGLLDVKLGPDFETSHLVYLSFYEPREGGNGLAVVRGRLAEGAKPRLESVQVIFRMEPTLDSHQHAGGRLVFTPDGFLFVTLGDRFIQEGRVQARDPRSDLGKIVRIRPDGSIPADNPFVGKPGARAEIWTLGHRNVLGAALDARHRLWIAEMGPRGGDELNLIGRGKDYGWPKIGYGEEYSGASIHEATAGVGLEQPVYYWDPVISPGALCIHSGKMFPEWRGNFLIAGLSSKALVRLVLKDDRVVGEERLLTERKERLRDVLEGPDGALYVLTDGSDAKLLKVVARRKSTNAP